MPNEMSTRDEEELSKIKAAITAYWTELMNFGDPGETTWDRLEFIQLLVTDRLFKGSPDDIKIAERLTAKAEYLRQGGEV